MTPRLRTLGMLALIDHTGQPLGGRPRVLALLAWLLRQPGQRATRDQAADLLWGDGDPSRARHSLRQAISELRAILPDDVLLVDPAAIAVVPGAVACDLADLEDALRAGDRRRVPELAAGGLLPGLDDLGGEAWREWLDAERGWVHRGIDAVFQERSAGAMQRGAWREAAEVGAEWSGLRPESEAAVRATVDAHLAAGEMVLASVRYHAFTDRCETEGVPVSAEFRRLGDQLRPGVQPGRLRRALMSPDMVGREREFARLTAAFELVQTGGAVAMVITGDEEGGRTRLLREFVHRVMTETPRALTIELAAAEVTEAIPVTLVGLLGDRLSTAPGLLAASRPDLESLGQAAPVIAARFPSQPEASLPRLADALPRVLGEVAAEVPLLLVIDDIDRADELSQGVISTLARRPPGRTMLVLTGRSGRLEQTSLHQALTAAGDRIEWLRLGPLDASGTLAVVRSMAPMEARDAAAVAEAAREDLGGLPGLTRALVERLAEDGLLAPDGSGVWRLTAPLKRPVSVPDRMRMVTQQSLGTLSPAAREMIETAAISPGESIMADLERASGLEPASFQDALAELLAARRLRTTREGLAVEFPSEAHRRAVAERLSPARRRQLQTALQPTSARRGRRRLLAGLAAVALFSVTSAALLLRPAAEAGVTIVLADVRNDTGDPIFDRTLTLAASMELVESQRFQVLPRARIREILSRMEQSEADSLFDEPLAREVAERAGVPLVLAMSLEPAETGLRLVARLIHPATGDAVRTLVEPVGSPDAVLAGVGRIVGRVRRALGESRAAVAAAPPLHEVTTSSLEALREYTRGQAAWARRDYGPAREAWERAIELDSAFAMSWASLADLHYWANRYPQGNAALQRAAALEHRLTPRERLLVRAKVADRFGSPEDGLHQRRLLAERYPSRDTWYNLGSALMRAGRCNEGLPALRRALDLDPGFTNGHINVATCFLGLQLRDSALVAYRRAAQTDSAVLLVGNIGEEYGRTLALHEGRPAAEVHYRRMASWGDLWNRARGHRHLAWLALAAGEYRLALAEADRAVAMYDAVPGAPLSRYRDEMLRAEALVGMGRLGEARREAERLWRTRPDSMMSVPFLRDAALLAWRTGADGILPEIEAGLASPWRAGQDAPHNSMAATIRGARLLAARQPDSALAATEPAMAVADSDGWHVFMAPRAQALASLGMPEDAYELWVRIASHPRLNNEAQAIWQIADLEAAKLAHSLGRSGEAWETVERVLNRWKDGDQEAPAYQAALRLRADLRREGGG